MSEHRSGFTLIELLIVIVIIGILATIAIPKFSTTKEKSLLTAMKADLRNLATQQEAYNADFSQYTTSFPLTVYRTTTGVIGPTIAVSTDGWTAWVSHTGTTKTCAIYMGSTSLSPAVKGGVPTCTN